MENTDFSSCVDLMKKFASRIKRAANIERQVKRIESSHSSVTKTEFRCGLCNVLLTGSLTIQEQETGKCHVQKLKNWNQEIK